MQIAEEELIALLRVPPFSEDRFKRYLAAEYPDADGSYTDETVRQLSWRCEDLNYQRSTLERDVILYMCSAAPAHELHGLLIELGSYLFKLPPTISKTGKIAAHIRSHSTPYFEMTRRLEVNPHFAAPD